jgi:hypothetical protein
MWAFRGGAGCQAGFDELGVENQKQERLVTKESLGALVCRRLKAKSRVLGSACCPKKVTHGVGLRAAADYEHLRERA